MLRDNPNRAEIIRAADGILRAADVTDFPTPETEVIEAARLHRGEDDLFAEETIAEAPAYLRKTIRALRGKVHAVLDRRCREVYVNPEITNRGRRRFRAFHEVGHSILPGQNRPAYADNRQTLSPFTRLGDERDANQVSSEIIFQRERFTEMANQYEVGMAAVVELAALFEASIQASLRRYVEFHRLPVACVVLELSPNRPGGLLRRYEAICSERWEESFERPDCWPPFLDKAVFPWIGHVRHAGEMPVEWEGHWPDRDNRMRTLQVEAISNSYKLLVLLWRPQRQVLKRRRRLVLADGS